MNPSNQPEPKKNDSPKVNQAHSSVDIAEVDVNKKPDAQAEVGLRDKVTRTVTRNMQLMGKAYSSGGKSYDFMPMIDELMAAIEADKSAAAVEARKTAKQENANDFTAIVESFNRAVKANYDHYSMQNLGFVINNADARAKYSDLPVQEARLQPPTAGEGESV